MSGTHCLSGSGGGRSLFIDPSGKGFSHSEERWGGLDTTNNNGWIATVTEALGDLAHLGGIP